MRAKVEEAVTAAVAEERAKNSESLEQARKDVVEQRKIAEELSKGRELEKETHVNEMETKVGEIREAVEALNARDEKCKQLEKDIENAEHAARWELWKERQLLGAKVMHVLLSCNNV